MSEVQPETSKDTPQHDQLIELTSQVVAAYVSNNATSTTDLPGLIETVYSTLNRVANPTEPEVAQDPAVPIKRSVKKVSIVCLDCGKAQKMLKRHLATAHGMTPQEYRAKWGLGPDYPMVAPDYAEKRRDLAKKIGLGRKPEKAPTKAAGKKAPTKAAGKKAPVRATAKAPAKRKIGGQKKG